MDKELKIESFQTTCVRQAIMLSVVEVEQILKDFATAHGYNPTEVKFTVAGLRQDGMFGTHGSLSSVKIFIE